MSNEPKTLYLAGPMSGIPQFNFPLFNVVAHALRNQGYRIISPAETDPEDVREAATQSPDGAYGADGKVGSESWGDMLSRDVKMLADGIPPDDFDAEGNELTDAKTLVIDGIALLPGWENSRGARLEAFVSLDLNKEFFTVERQAAAAGATAPQSYWLNPAAPEWVQHMLAKKWADAIQMHKPIPYAHTIP